MDNSTSQLRSFQVVEEPIISKLEHLKRRTKTVINSYLKRLLRIITIVSQSYFTSGLVKEKQGKNFVMHIFLHGINLVLLLNTSVHIVYYCIIWGWLVVRVRGRGKGWGSKGLNKKKNYTSRGKMSVSLLSSRERNPVFEIWLVMNSHVSSPSIDLF